MTSVLRPALMRRATFSEGYSNAYHTIAVIRLLDVTIALAALTFFAPLMAIVGCAVFLYDGGPIFFSHRRIGLGGKRFNCLKFRSMRPDAEARLAQLLANDPAARLEWNDRFKLDNDPRITPIGAFLRRSSLDELPQLLNVLRGEMSIVGPRPIIEKEIVKYGHRFRHYCSVKPGLTGIWQVSGRNSVAYRRRVAMDCVYAKRQSVAIYLWVVLATIPAVLSGDGSQ